MMPALSDLVAGVGLYLTSLGVILLGTGSDGLLDQGLKGPRDRRPSLHQDGAIACLRWQSDGVPGAEG